MTSPALAGLLTTGVPSDCAAAKTPGEYTPTAEVTVLLKVPFTGEPARVPLAVGPSSITVNGVVPLPMPSSHGTWRLIWVGETNCSGAANPLTNTVTPPSFVGNPVAGAETTLVAKPDP